MDQYNDDLAQVTDIYSAVDDSNYGKQKVYKKHDFSRAALILECDTTKEAEGALINATSSKEEK